MTRGLVQLKNDFRLLFRHKLVHATVFMTVFWIALMLLVIHFEGASALPVFIPLMLLTDTATIGFYFLAGLVLFEKDQMVIKGLIVSPLKPFEYIGSKVISLSLLAVFSGIVIAIVTLWGKGVNLAWAVVGLFMISMLYALVGFISVTKFDNIIKYLFIGALYFLFLNLPILGMFGLWDGITLYLHPVQPFVLLISAPFVGIETWQIFYSLGYGTGIIALAFYLAKRSYETNIIGKGV
jgi:fluoroquinolone transport system permease protein